MDFIRERIMKNDYLEAKQISYWQLCSCVCPGQDHTVYSKVKAIQLSDEQ